MTLVILIPIKPMARNEPYHRVVSIFIDTFGYNLVLGVDSDDVNG